MTTQCALSGITLDDGNPLHRSTLRLYEGAELVVCRAVANFIDRPGMRPQDVRSFVETLRTREEREAAFGHEKDVQRWEGRGRGHRAEHARNLAKGRAA